MRWQGIEFQRLDMRERPGSFQATHIRDRRVGTDIDEYLAAAQQTRSAIVQPYFDRFGRHEAPASHNQLGAGSLVGVQMQRDLPLDHALLAGANLGHVGPDRAGHRPELVRGLRQMCDPGAPDLVLAGHARDSRARAAHPLPLHDGRAPT